MQHSPVTKDKNEMTNSKVTVQCVGHFKYAPTLKLRHFWEVSSLNGRKRQMYLSLLHDYRLAKRRGLNAFVHFRVLISFLNAKTENID